MQEAIDFLINGITYTFDQLNAYTFEIYGMQVSFFTVFIGFIALYLVISAFWKGARG